MRPETILQALSETRPALLDEAAEPRMSRRRLRPLYRAVLIAAVLLLLAGSVYAGAKALAPRAPATEIHNPGGFDVHFSRKVARRAMGDGWVFPKLPKGLPSPLKMWLDAIENGGDIPCTIDEAVALSKVMEMAYGNVM